MVGWMVIRGHRSYNSTFGANNIVHPRPIWTLRVKEDDDDGKVKESRGGVSGFAGRQAKATRKEKI